MFRRVALVLALTWVSSSLFAIDFTKYHSQDEIGQYLRGVATSYPELAHFYVLGKSDEGREVAYLTMTSGADSLPGIFFNGTHHGNEWSSTEALLGLVEYFVQHRNDAEVAGLLSKYVFYFQPLVNPDGHFHRTREDANGADPNRDYEYPNAPTGSQFKTKIISLMKKLIDSHHFRAAAAYHSGIEEVIWPWCYTSAPTEQKDLFYTFAKGAASAMGFSRYMQSYYDYPTDGEFIDYMFMTQGTFALTYEVSDDFTPAASQLKAIVARSVKGAMAFINAVAAHDAGHLSVESSASIVHALEFNPRWKAMGRRLE
jgi:hypothetical protein